MHEYKKIKYGLSNHGKEWFYYFANDKFQTKLSAVTFARAKKEVEEIISNF